MTQELFDEEKEFVKQFKEGLKDLKEGKVEEYKEGCFLD